MRFWDSSALVPLLVPEPRSGACRRLLRGDPQIVVWASTPTEMISAVRRRERDGTLAREELRVCLRRCQKLGARWTEIDALTAADALQLGAALVLVDGRPRRRGFVTADMQLASVAEAQGFEAIVPGG